MVGKEALMRLSSVTLPSCMGTLKSTRIRTRLPLRSISRTVFLFMGCSACKQVDKKTGTQVVYLSTCVLLQAFRNQGCQIRSAASIAPFIVIPCHNLDHVA